MELFVGIVQYLWEKNQQQRYFDSKLMLDHLCINMIYDNKSFWHKNILTTD